MTAHRSPAASSNSLNFLDPDVALSLVTVPVLGAIVAGSAIANAVQTVGVLSEEIFRGDRLPVLDLGNQTEPDHSEQP
jgi:hypothetical protein